MKPEPLIRSHMPELDSLRGIAVLGVLLVHGFVFRYDFTGYHGALRLFLRATAMGKLGVNLFFVLSGFLITGILVKSRESATYYKPFYWKRACRILPPYVLTILVVALTTRAWKFALASTLFLANVSELFGVTSAYGPLWSLAVEEHYYLIWPTVVRHLSRKGISAVAILLVVAAPILRYGLIVHGWPAHLATWFQCDGLAIGSLLRIAMARWPYRPGWKIASAALMFLALAGILMLTAFHVASDATAIGNALQMSCWNLLFAGFLLCFLILGTGRFRRFSNPAPLALVGYVSYGLYLYHLLVYEAFDWLFPRFNMFARFAIVVPTAIFIAWLSRRFYEEYFLQKKRLIDRPGAAVAAAEGN